MNKKWENKLLKVSKRGNDNEMEQFLKLVDEANNKCDYETTKILMKTFFDDPDYSTQERVVSVLSTANDKDFDLALLEELPRLIREAPSWAETLLGCEIDNRPDLLIEITSKIPKEIINSLKEFINKDDFIEFYPNTKKILSKL